MARTLILGGRVVDPAAQLEGRRELVLEGERIALVCRPGSRVAEPGAGDRVIDAAGLLVLPGLIDLHVHLREPGDTRAEDVGSGSRAAAAGGFTTVVCMPNTRPVLDSPARLGRLQASVRRKAVVRVLPAAALSMGLQGRRLTDAGALARCGAAALSDDGLGTANLGLLRDGIRGAAAAGLPVLAHCEDRRLSRNGVVQAGKAARRLRLPGISAAAESEATERAIRAVRHTHGRLHVQHVSTAGALAAVRRAKRAGLWVTAEVTPHHLFLDVEAVVRPTASGQPDPNLKMNPPLRSRRDRMALLEGLADGSLDAVASDHAPHTRDSKDRGFVEAPFGVIGLETTLPLVLRLVEEGVVSLERAVALLTIGPARVLGRDTGTLRPGSAADVTVVDPDKVWRVRPSAMRSRSRNTAFAGWILKGKASWTIVAGRVVRRPGDGR